VRIGICGIGYQCGEHLDEVLQPWFDLKINGRHEMLISLAYGIFPEVYSFTQVNPETPDGSLPSLREYLSERKIDALHVSPEPKYEWDLRTCTLPFLLRGQIDVIWLLDLQDEIYSVNEILRIIEFIESHPEIIWFRVNFKNYAFDFDSYIDEFAPPRVWRARIPAAIRCFHYDNCITYEDEQRQDSLPRCTIPKELAFPRHLSWVGTPEYLQRKINYQLLHFGTCSYKWDQGGNCLQFNEEYYLRAGKPVPKVYRDSDAGNPLVLTCSQ